MGYLPSPTAPHPPHTHRAPPHSIPAGMPAALLLQRGDATVTIIHSKTPNAAEICREADIIIAACGVAEMVKGDWVKEGAAVIDVGINAVDVSARAGLAGARAGAVTLEQQSAGGWHGCASLACAQAWDAGVRLARMPAAGGLPGA